MNNNTKKIIMIVVVLLIIGGIIFATTRGKEEEDPTNEFVDMQKDGTRVNVSSKLAQKKNLEGLEISNIRLTEKNNLSVILADVENKTSQTTTGFDVTITLLDKTGTVITTTIGYIKGLDAGEKTVLNTSTTNDLANAYDFTITRK